LNSKNKLGFFLRKKKKIETPKKEIDVEKHLAAA